ncbi:hypothetical protein ACXJJ3_32930 [Kribbella sp. WER1]
MQAEAIKAGDRYEEHDDMGKIVPEQSWTAITDAQASEDETAVYVYIRFDTGETTRNTFSYGAQVPLTFGVGS